MIVTQLLPGHHRLFGWKKNWTGDKSSFSVPVPPPTLCRRAGRERVNGGSWAPALHKMDTIKYPEEEVTARQP